MKKSLFIGISVLVGLLMISCGSTNNNNDDLILKISPSSQITSIDEEITYQVKVENVEDLFAISLEIVFDGTFVELPDEPLSIGSCWGSDVISTYVSEIDRINVAIGLTQGGNLEELEGDETLFEFTILGKAAGESEISVYNLTMIDDEGNLIEDFDEIEIENSYVTVQ
jgi:hypothetical protein